MHALPPLTTVAAVAADPVLGALLDGAGSPPSDAPAALGDAAAAVASPSPAGWTVQPLVAPGAGADGVDEAVTCIRTLLRGPLAPVGPDPADDRGLAEAHVWVSDHGSLLQRSASARLEGPSLVRIRHLVQLRAPLPLAERTDLPTRAFRVGHDEAAWVAVNNRAFAWHPEQRERTVADVERLEREPWFDPEGFLVHEDETGTIDGFCWTRVHAELSPPEGEIFVIGVDPAAHGRGLGRGLTVAGFAHLAGRGLRAGMLWAEADNTAALGLYGSLGFTEVRRREALVFASSWGDRDLRPS